MPDPHSSERESDAELSLGVLHRLFETNPLPTWVHDRHTRRFISVNPAMLEQYGVEEDELPELSADDLDWEGKPDEAGAEAPSEEVRIATEWHKARDGRRFMVRTTVRSVEMEGRAAEIVVAEPLIPLEGYPPDSGSKGNSPALGTEGWERFLDRTLSRLPDGFFTLDRNWRFTFLNEEATRLFGRSRGELLGTAIWEEFPELISTPFFPAYKETMDRGKPTRLEAPVPTWDRWYREHAYPLEDGIAVHSQEITEDRKAQSRLHFQSQLLEWIDQPVVASDASDRITYWNRAAETLFGWRSEEVTGSWAVEKLVHEEDLDSFRKARERANQGRAWSGELRFRKRSGGTVTCWASIAAARNPDGSRGGLIATAVDITGRKKMEAALRESETLFRQIAEAGRTVFWIERPGQQGLEYVSPAYAEIWGRNPAELYVDGQRWRQSVHPEDRDRVWSAAENMVDETYEVEYRIIRPDGSLRWIWERTFPIEGQDGRVYRIVGISEDVTERKDLEEELRHAQKMEALGRLCGGVAHDFNNRLTVIEGASETLLQDLPSDSEHRGPVEEVVRESEQLAQLTHQLLAYSRRQVLHERTLDAARIISEMKPMLLRLLPESVELEMVLPDEPCFVRCDGNQLQQVVLNLAINAADAVDGSGRVTVRVERVTVGPSEPECAEKGVPSGEHVCLSVEDNGVGIEPDLLERIFEPFFTTKPQGQGTGLGLSTVYGAVAQSGGHVAADSTPGEGARFRAFLPISDGPEDRESPPDGERGESISPKGSGTVLLVEDEAAVRSVARRALERHGYTVVEAESGTAALSRIRDDGLRPVVVVSDVVMPEMSGLELVARIQDEGLHPAVVLTSGYSSLELAEEVQRTFTTFLEKPFTPNALARSVSQALAEHRAPSDPE